MRALGLGGLGLVVEPRGDPEAAAREILEYEVGRVEHERLTRHAAVGDERGVLVEQAHHVAGRPAAHTVERESRPPESRPQLATQRRLAHVLLGVDVLTAAHASHELHELVPAGRVLTLAHDIDHVEAHLVGELYDRLADAAVGAVLNDRVAGRQRHKVSQHSIGRARIDGQRGQDVLVGLELRRLVEVRGGRADVCAPRAAECGRRAEWHDPVAGREVSDAGASVQHLKEALETHTTRQLGRQRGVLALHHVHVGRIDGRRHQAHDQLVVANRCVAATTQLILVQADVTRRRIGRCCCCCCLHRTIGVHAQLAHVVVVRATTTTRPRRE